MLFRSNVSSQANVATVNVSVLSGNTVNVYQSNAVTLYAANIYTTNISGFIGSQWVGTVGNPIYYVPQVGIGSSATPTANLQVTGNLYVSNSITTAVMNTNAFTINGQAGLQYQYLQATGSGANVQWSSAIFGTSQGYLLTLQSSYSLGTAFVTSSGIQGFHINMGSFTAEASQSVTLFSITNNLFKFNLTGLYQLTCVLVSDQPISKVAVGKNSTNSFPGTVSYDYVYSVPLGSSPSVVCTVPINVTDISQYYYVDAYFSSGATVLYPTRSTSVTGAAYGTYFQVSPFGNYLTSASGLPAGLLANCTTSSNLSGVYNSNAFRVALTTANGWTVNGTSTSITVTSNGNLSFNQPGIYELSTCLFSGITPAQVQVGSLANDTLSPNSTTPQYIYTYMPMFTQDPTTSIVMPVNITNTGNVYFIECSFSGTVTGNVALNQQSTFVMAKPVGSYLNTQPSPWSQQGTTLYYLLGNVGIGTSVAYSNLTISGNIFVSNTVTTPNINVTSLNAATANLMSLIVPGVANISTLNVSSLANISTLNATTANLIFANITTLNVSSIENVITLNEIGRAHV